MNLNKKLLLIVAALAITVFAIGCGGESKEEKQADQQAATAEKQAKEAKEQAKQEAKQAKKEAKQAQNMSAEEKKEAAAATQAQAGEQSAEQQASQAATDAANAEAQAADDTKKKSGSGGGTASAGGSQSCGGGVEVNASTSCAFAQNVVDAWEKNESATVSAYSPDTGKTYTMSCSGSQMLTTCTGGAGAKVTFTP